MITNLHAPANILAIYESEIAHNIAHRRLVREALAARPRQENGVVRLVKRLFSRPEPAKPSGCTCQCA